MKIVDFAERWAGLMWEASVTASVLAVVAGLIVWALRKRLGPSWRFALWGIVLVRLLLPMTPQSNLSLFNLGHLVESKPAERRAIAPIPLAPALNDSFLEGELDAGELEVATVGDKAQRGLDWGVVLALGWLAGVVFLSAKLILGAWWLRWRVARESGGAGEKLEGIWAAAAREMGLRTRSRVILTDLVNSPALFGIWHPQLLMPRNFAETLDEAQLRHVFLHELAHLKRGDLLTNGCMAVAQVLHWWNPVVGFVLAKMRLERELACDEMVLRLMSGGARGEATGRAYGETVLRLIEGANGGKRIPALVGIAEEKKAVRTRLEQIAGFGARPKTARVFGGLLVFVLATVGLTGAQEKKEPHSDLEGGAEMQSSVVRWLDETKALIEQKRWDDAAAVLHQAIKAAPKHDEAMELLIMVRNEQFKDKATQYREESRKRERWSTDPAGVRTLIREERERTGSGRKALLQKLNELVIDHYEVPNALPLTEIIKDIYSHARKLDPRNTGVNFIISSQLENPGLIEGSDGSGANDENGRKPLKVGDYRVTISPALREVTLLDLVNAIVEVAVPPEGHEGAPRLKYSIEDYAVVFGQRRNETPALYTRTFKVDPNAFLQGLDFDPDHNAFIQADGEGRLTAVQKAVREFFESAGVDFSAKGNAGGPQKAIFFNDRTGVLMARLPLEELQIVEKALQRLNVRPELQVMISVEAVELSAPEELAELTDAMKVGGELRTTLTDREYREFQGAAARQGFRWSKRPPVTTYSGGAARVQVLGNQAVDVVAEYRESNRKFKVRAVPSDHARGFGGAKEALVGDGETLVLMPFTDNKRMKPPRVLFIRVDLVDAAGNKVNAAD